jgi:hypothetical protein
MRPLQYVKISLWISCGLIFGFIAGITLMFVIFQAKENKELADRHSEYISMAQEVSRGRVPLETVLDVLETSSAEDVPMTPEDRLLVLKAVSDYCPDMTKLELSTGLNFGGKMVGLFNQEQIECAVKYLTILNKFDMGLPEEDVEDLAFIMVKNNGCEYVRDFNMIMYQADGAGIDCLEVTNLFLGGVRGGQDPKFITSLIGSALEIASQEAAKQSTP